MTEDWRALLEQASALRRSGRAVEAIEAYERLLAVQPDLPDSWYNLGWLQRQAGRFDQGLASYRQAIDRGVSGPEEAHLNCAVILADHLNRVGDAEAELRAALAINPDYAPALLNLGNVAEDLGRREDARGCYQRALEAEPGNVLALARLAGVATPAGAGDPLIARLRDSLARGDISASDRADLGFALGRLLDAAGDFEAAFAVYRNANAASRASFGPAFQSYDATSHEACVERLIAAFDRPPSGSGDSAGANLIFICGMFRSGSTLAEQILACHGGVGPGGELDLLPALIDRELQPYPEAAAKLGQAKVERLRTSYAEGLKRLGLCGGLVTDKRPDNFLHIGLIKTLFPAAKIIHTRRNPRDNLLALYFLQVSPLVPYALELSDSVHWYRQYRRLMDHWQSLYPRDLFDLDYDQLVAEPRPVIEAMLNFCGLEWQESCLDFHRASNPVKTASVWQVRQPLYTRSSGRWRNYQAQLEPLQPALQGLD